ncbi:MAG: MarR family transcriptional regulator [Firmicutes bacterium]|nr:MarR family transcriptional regulator [Bacillota bacterium]
MDYIEETLGEKVIRHLWDAGKSLPPFLVDAYDFFDAAIGAQNCLIIVPRKELCAVPALKKQIAHMQQACDVPVVLELAALSRQRRQTLVAEKVPFVVPGKQLFLPFMGAMLQEKFDSEAPQVETLQPSAQMLLFWFIYQKCVPLYVSRLPEKFGFTAMSISRAAAQLINTGLLDVHKDGVQKVLTSQLPAKELFEKARPFLFDPVRRRFYIDKADVQESYFSSGESTLAEQSMLNPPNVEVYGMAKTIKPASATLQLIDGGKQCELEIWRYDPTILSGKHRADPLSLAMSLSRVRDERVEMSIDEMLKGVWG